MTGHFAFGRDKKMQTYGVFSSSEPEVLRVTYCDSAVSVISRASFVVNFLACVRSRGHIFSPIIMKLRQNVCLNKISDDFENESWWVKK